MFQTPSHCKKLGSYPVSLGSHGTSEALPAPPGAPAPLPSPVPVTHSRLPAGSGYHGRALLPGQLCRRASGVHAGRGEDFRGAEALWFLADQPSQQTAGSRPDPPVIRREHCHDVWKEPHAQVPARGGPAAVTARSWCWCAQAVPRSAHHGQLWLVLPPKFHKVGAGRWGSWRPGQRTWAPDGQARVLWEGAGGHADPEAPRGPHEVWEAEAVPGRSPEWDGPLVRGDPAARGPAALQQAAAPVTLGAAQNLQPAWASSRQRPHADWAQVCCQVRLWKPVKTGQDAASAELLRLERLFEAGKTGQDTASAELLCFVHLLKPVRLVRIQWVVKIAVLFSFWSW